MATTSKATYKAAHRAIRIYGNVQVAWASEFDGMPTMARTAAVEAYLAKLHARPAQPLADRLANHKVYKQIFA